MPTSIAVDSGNGTIYVAESIMENDNIDNSSLVPSSFSSVSFPLEQQQQPQVRIVKAAISDTNTTTIVNNALIWPVIDMEFDDATGVMYTFDGHTTISRMNMTSGEREDVVAKEEDEEASAAAGNDKYEEQDPLSLLIHSSSQIALGREEDYLYSPDGNGENGNSNYDSHYLTVLYLPCTNGEVDKDYDKRYCILSLPIDSSNNDTIVDNISNINNNPSSFIVQNMTSRPVGIAILNSSDTAASSSSPSSSFSATEQQRPYAITRNETSNSFGTNNYTELLIITSDPTTGGNSIVNINNNENNSENSSNYNHPQQQALPPSIEALANYSDGQLGKVVAVLVPPVTMSSYSNDTLERSQAPSTVEDIVSSSPPLPFGLNKTTAFIVDFGNSSDSAAATAAPQLPKIIMLDVQTGSITPFLTLKHPDSTNFTPVDIAFDYNNSALYVLSIGNNQEDTNSNNSSNSIINPLHTGTSNNNNSGVVWKISYQGEEGQAATSSNSSSSNISNSTDSNNSSNATGDATVPPPSSSSNDTASSDNSTSDSSSDASDDTSNSDDSSSYDEEEDDTYDSSSSDDEPPPPASDDSDGNSTSSEDTADNNSEDDNSESSPPPPSSQPPTQPVNNAPIAEDDTTTTDQDTPVVIDVLANDTDADDDDSLTIDSVDEESIQGGNVRIISGNDDGDNNNSGDNTNAKIEYTPAEGFFGNDEFTYTIVDTNGATDSAKVTVTVNEIIIAPHPISYWLENEDEITQDLLEKAAEDNDDEWSFKLGNFGVPVEFDVSDSKNDTKGILEGGEANSNNNDDNINAHDQLAAQLLATKLNIENGVSTCESIETTIEYADTILRNAQYDGPGSTENPTGEDRDYAFELIDILDRYNNNGCA
jgi:hypothetical protein